MEKEYLECPRCLRNDIPYGATVCRCGAEILYGPTGEETMTEGVSTGIVSGGCIGCGCIVPLLAVVLISFGVLKDPLEPWFVFIGLIIVVFMMVLLGVAYGRNKGSNDHRVRFVWRNRYL